MASVNAPDTDLPNDLLYDVQTMHYRCLLSDALGHALLGGKSPIPSWIYFVPRKSTICSMRSKTRSWEMSSISSTSEMRCRGKVHDPLKDRLLVLRHCALRNALLGRSMIPFTALPTCETSARADADLLSRTQASGGLSSLPHCCFPQGPLEGSC